MRSLLQGCFEIDLHFGIVRIDLVLKRIGLASQLELHLLQLIH